MDFRRQAGVSHPSYNNIRASREKLTQMLTFWQSIAPGSSSYGVPPYPRRILAVISSVEDRRTDGGDTEGVRRSVGGYADYD